MPVESEVSKSGPYNCDGVQDTFEYKFKVFDGSWMDVFTTPPGENDFLEPKENYTVTGVGLEEGTVVMNTPPPAGYKLTIVRSQPLTQNKGFTNQAGYRGQSHEQVYDRMIMQVQQVDEAAQRSLRAPVSEEGGTNYDLPSFVAGLLWGWGQTPEEGITLYTPNTDAYLTIPLPFSQGGTGASYADLNALLTAWGLTDLAKLNIAQFWSKLQGYTLETAAISSGAVYLNFERGYMRIDMTENITSVTTPSLITGVVYTAGFRQQAGIYTIDGWPSSWQWINRQRPAPDVLQAEDEVLEIELRQYDTGVIAASFAVFGDAP